MFKRIFGLAVVLILASFMYFGCSKESIKQIAGPIEYDTLTTVDTVIQIDTVQVTLPPDEGAYYLAAQEFTRESYTSMYFYWPAIGDPDILIEEQDDTTKIFKVIVLGWLPDWSQYDWFSGTFRVIYVGPRFSVTDITPQQQCAATNYDGKFWRVDGKIAAGLTKFKRIDVKR